MKEEVISFFTAPTTYLALLCSIAAVYVFLKIFKRVFPAPDYAIRIFLSMVIVIVAGVVYIFSFSFIGNLLK